MSQSIMNEGLMQAEGLLVQGQNDLAEELLSRMAEDAEEYVSRNCETTNEVQWFSFPTLFERLAYRRVEDDPRELREMEEPLDRLYSDLGLACVRLGDYARATEALKQAVRWNPMDCGHRLNLADLFRTNGDMNEWLALSYSVFERASDANHLVRAYLNFAQYYEQTDRPKQQAACLRFARRLDMPSSALEDAIGAVRGSDADPDLISDDQAREVVAEDGIPEGANAEIAVCMLMCASDAARTGHRDLATNLTVRACDLVGAPAATALIEMIHAADAEDDAVADVAVEAPDGEDGGADAD